jgi:branched-chain amino acid aminotransferase
VDDRITMFRINENFKRMLNSHKQLGLPAFDVDQYTECCRRLIEIEKDWIPNKPMHSMYIRPTSICMDNKLGIGKVTKAKTFIILSPVGPYYPRGFVPVKLFCDTSVIRAWPNGWGDQKLGG